MSEACRYLRQTPPLFCSLGKNGSLSAESHIPILLYDCLPCPSATLVRPPKRNGSFSRRSKTFQHHVDERRRAIAAAVLFSLSLSLVVSAVRLGDGGDTRLRAREVIVQRH